MANFLFPFVATYFSALVEGQVLKKSFSLLFPAKAFGDAFSSAHRCRSPSPVSRPNGEAAFPSLSPAA